MTRRLVLATSAAALLALLLATPALAGGWASVTVEEGTSSGGDGGSGDGGSGDGGSGVGITLLQHGVTPVTGGTVTVQAVNQQTGERLTETGRPRAGDDGHWTTWIQLPAGTWALTISHSELIVDLAQPLSVTVGTPAPAAADTAAQASATSSAVLLALAALLFIGLSAGGIGLALMRGRGRAPLAVAGR
jgi:hypothetical protein